MNREEILKAQNTKILELAENLRIAYQLKKTIRYAGTRDLSIHGESVAEHIFALLFLTQYFLPLEDPQEKLDRLKIYEIILYHDFGEIPNGDIPYHLKTEDHEKQEEEDAKKVFSSFPEPLSDTGLKRWREYHQLRTPEALFVCALDKIEPTFELLDPVGETSLKRTKFTYKDHIEKKIKATEGFPVMRKFVDAISEHLKNKKAFWDE